MKTMRGKQSLTIPKERIAGFFRTYVNEWLLGDIRYCARQEKNLSFTVATLVLNAVDFFGSLYAGRDSTKQTFKEFLNKYMPRYTTVDDEIDLYAAYRCGLVHQYFPQNGHSVVWNNEREHLTKIDGRYVINAQSLVSDLGKAISTYEQTLYCQEGLRGNFSARMFQIVANPIEAWFSDGMGRSDTVEVVNCLFDDTLPIVGSDRRGDNE